METQTLPVKVVYIAGCSYSGTTLMGFLLGSHPRVFFAGEVNQFNRPGPLESLPPQRRTCTCGAPFGACPVWSRVRERASDTADLNPAPGLSARNLAMAMRALGPFRLPPAPPYSGAYANLLHVIQEAARQQTPDLEWLVDSSKSLSGLVALAAEPSIDLRVVHVVRDGRGVMASYGSRGLSRSYGVGAWSIGNLSLMAYCRRRDLPVLRVDYAQVCTDPGATLARLGDFLGIQLESHDVGARVASTTYHAYEGNEGVRQGIPSFDGIRYRPPVLRGFSERLLSAALLNPLNRFLGLTTPSD